MGSGVVVSYNGPPLKEIYEILENGDARGRREALNTLYKAFNEVRYSLSELGALKKLGKSSD